MYTNDLEDIEGGAARVAAVKGVAALAAGEGDAPRKRVLVLGSSGSIGRQTLDVVRQHADKLQVVGLAVYSNIDVLAAQAVEFGVRHLAVGDASLAGSAAAGHLGEVLGLASGCRVTEKASLGFGAQACEALVQLPEVDIVVNALVGAAGLRASYLTLRAGKTLALANKESLVVGGDLIMPLSEQLDCIRGFKGALMPVDSEHGAIYQCLLGENTAEVSRLWVTASGGPFRGCTLDQLRDITPARALAHPTWAMGPKISIDSSTLMNKGLEVIEAHHLFAMPYDRIKVLVQPQSLIHSMVEYADGSVKAHLGTTDMRIPIQFALSYPERWAAPVAPLDFTQLAGLSFDAPDEQTFRCLALARCAGETGGTLPCVMNAANEVAVAAFLAGQNAYLDIPACVETVMEHHRTHGVQQVESVEQLLECDAWARDDARRFLRTC